MFRIDISTISFDYVTFLALFNGELSLVDSDDFQVLTRGNIISGKCCNIGP